MEILSHVQVLGKGVKKTKKNSFVPVVKVDSDGDRGRSSVIPRTRWGMEEGIAG